MIEHTRMYLASVLAAATAPANGVAPTPGKKGITADEAPKLARLVDAGPQQIMVGVWQWFTIEEAGDMNCTTASMRAVAKDAPCAWHVAASRDVLEAVAVMVVEDPDDEDGVNAAIDRVTVTIERRIGPDRLAKFGSAVIITSPHHLATCCMRPTERAFRDLFNRIDAELGGDILHQCLRSDWDCYCECRAIGNLHVNTRAGWRGEIGSLPGQLKDQPHRADASTGWRYVPISNPIASIMAKPTDVRGWRDGYAPEKAKRRLVIPVTDKHGRSETGGLR